MSPKKKTSKKKTSVKTPAKTIDDVMNEMDTETDLKVAPEPDTVPDAPDSELIKYDGTTFDKAEPEGPIHSEIHGVTIVSVDGLNSYEVSRLALGVKEVFRTQNHKGRITVTLDSEKLR